MKKQFGYLLFTAVILAACLLPSAGMLFAGGTETGGNEVLSRLHAPRDAEGNWNPDYLSDLSSYAEDNYFLRQQMVTAWSDLNRNILHTSISDSVLLGRGGWLYFGDTLDDYTGIQPLSRSDILSAAHNLALAAEYSESQGAQFLFTIAPNKNSLYPQWMPELPVFSQSRNAAALYDALQAENVGYCDLFSVFSAQNGPLYFAQDSHWNSKGAALAADSINAALDRQSAYFSGPFSPQAVHKGDLYNMLCPAGTELDTDLVYEGSLNFTYDAPIRSAENLTIMTTGSGEGSLLMFRDSFGNLLYPYLADSFASALFSRSPDYKLNLIEQRNAYYVVIELVERNIPYLLENLPVMPAPARELPEEILPQGPAVSLTAEASDDLPGYMLVRGTLPEDPDAGASIFLSGGGNSCEAFRLRDGGFGLYIPETVWEAGSLMIVCTVDGQTVSFPAM